MLGQMLGSMFSVLWGVVRAHPVLIVFLALAAIALGLSRLPAVKGWLGETLMKIGFALFLPKDVYRVIHNVTIPDDQGGTTQIDHVIVSRFGIFAVETKNYKGWIFGGEHDRQWTQKIHGNHSQKFQNPLRQNYKHTECLASLLGLEGGQIQSVVVFAGDCTLKTRDKLPLHVTYPGGCVRFIKSRTEPVFDEAEVQSLESAIQAKRLAPGWRTSREHVAYVKSLHPDKANAAATDSQVPAPAPVPAAPIPRVPEEPQAEVEPVCPKCGAAMVLREAKRGANAGGRFWGCTNYPKCRHIVSLAPVAE